MSDIFFLILLLFDKNDKNKCFALAKGKIHQQEIKECLFIGLNLFVYILYIHYQNVNTKHTGGNPGSCVYVEGIKTRERKSCVQNNNTKQVKPAVLTHKNFSQG